MAVASTGFFYRGPFFISFSSLSWATAVAPHPPLLTSPKPVNYCVPAEKEKQILFSVQTLNAFTL
jgi:hypothetical protein